MESRRFIPFPLLTPITWNTIEALRHDVQIQLFILPVYGMFFNLSDNNNNKKTKQQKKPQKGC